MLNVEGNGGGRTRLQVEREMTIYTAAELKPALMEQLDRCTELEINLSRVTELDSAGLQILVLAKREAARLGKPLRLVGHSPATLEVLDLLNMAPYFGDPVVIPQHS